MLSGCATVPPLALQKVGDARQAVLVESSSKHRCLARVTFWQYADGHWHRQFLSMAAVIGRNGLAPAGEKKEGDGRTPSGMFDIGTAFGYAPALLTGLAYRQAQADDFWVDDVASANYNQWVKAPTRANSFEKLKRDDHLYKMAAVIEYNTRPVVPGAGSAIFMHIWRHYDRPTAGCVALSERNVRRILKHLDKNKNPVIILGETNGH